MGRGRSKAGKKKYFGRNNSFKVTDWFKKLSTSPDQYCWSRRFGELSPKNIEELFENIKNFFPENKRVRNKYVFNRNKLIIFIHFLHSGVRPFEIGLAYNDLRESTTRLYFKHAAQAIKKRFKHSDIIGFPSDESKKQMAQSMCDSRKPLPGALFYCDGTKRRTYGQSYKELRTKSYGWRPCVNTVFIFNRFDKSICAYTNRVAGGTTHDKVLFDELQEKDENFYRHMRSFPCLADGGFLGADTRYVAFNLKDGDSAKETFSKSFWHAFHSVRSGVENRFADFFHRQWRSLSFWQGTGADTLRDFDLYCFAACVMWNCKHKTCLD